MDELELARSSLALSVEDVQRAISRVRSAQEVDWVLVFAGNYRAELYGAIQDLALLRDRLERLWGGFA